MGTAGAGSQQQRGRGGRGEGRGGSGNEFPGCGTADLRWTVGLAAGGLHRATQLQVQLHSQPQSPHVTPGGLPPREAGRARTGPQAAAPPRTPPTCKRGGRGEVQQAWVCRCRKGGQGEWRGAAENGDPSAAPREWCVCACRPVLPHRVACCTAAAPAASHCCASAWWVPAGTPNARRRWHPHPRPDALRCDLPAHTSSLTRFLAASRRQGCGRQSGTASG